MGNGDNWGPGPVILSELFQRARDVRRDTWKHATLQKGRPFFDGGTKTRTKKRFIIFMKNTLFFAYKTKLKEFYNYVFV